MGHGLAGLHAVPHALGFPGDHRSGTPSDGRPERDFRHGGMGEDLGPVEFRNRREASAGLYPANEVLLGVQELDRFPDCFLVFHLAGNVVLAVARKTAAPRYSPEPHSRFHRWPHNGIELRVGLTARSPPAPSSRRRSCRPALGEFELGLFVVHADVPGQNAAILLHVEPVLDVRPEAGMAEVEASGPEIESLVSPAVQGPAVTGGGKEDVLVPDPVLMPWTMP